MKNNAKMQNLGQQQDNNQIEFSDFNGLLKKIVYIGKQSPRTGATNLNEQMHYLKEQVHKLYSNNSDGCTKIQKSVRWSNARTVWNFI